MEALYDFVVFAVAAPAISVVKNWLGLEGKPALYLAAGISVVAAGLLGLLGGDFAGGAFDPTSILETAGGIFAVATLVYKSVTA